jgi:GTP pyrophosphokinase
MFLAMAKDIRVIIIKLADRLHNLRTLQYQTAAKQIEKARETMDIYAPIAKRLGISRIQIEMDDLCMQYLYPEVYAELRESIGERLSERQGFITDMVNEVTHYIKEAEIDAEIEGRITIK